jgi:hypothetical protein
VLDLPAYQNDESGADDATPSPDEKA